MLSLLSAGVLSTLICSPCEDGYSSNGTVCCVPNVCTSPPPLRADTDECIGKVSGDECELFCDQDPLVNITITLLCDDSGGFQVKEAPDCLDPTCGTFIECDGDQGLELIPLPNLVSCPSEGCTTTTCCTSSCYSQSPQQCLSNPRCLVSPDQTCSPSRCLSTSPCSGNCYFDIDLQSCVSLCPQQGGIFECLSKDCLWAGTCAEGTSDGSCKVFDTVASCTEIRGQCEWNTLTSSCNHPVECGGVGKSSCYISPSCAWDFEVDGCITIPYCGSANTQLSCDALSECVFDSRFDTCQPKDVFGPPVEIPITITSPITVVTEVFSFCRQLEDVIGATTGAVISVKTELVRSTDTLQQDGGTRADVTIQFKGPTQGFEHILIEGTKSADGWILGAISSIAGPAIGLPAVEESPAPDTTTPGGVGSQSGMDPYFVLFFVGAASLVLAVILGTSQYRDAYHPQKLLTPPEGTKKGVGSIPHNPRDTPLTVVLYHLGWHCPPHALCWRRDDDDVALEVVGDNYPVVYKNPVDEEFPKGQPPPLRDMSAASGESGSSVLTPDVYEQSTVSVGTSSRGCPPPTPPPPPPPPPIPPSRGSSAIKLPRTPPKHDWEKI